MIQLYAHIDDLIPTEPRDRIFRDGSNMEERIARFKESIKNGWKWSKRINPDGTLSKGNATYYICKDLGIEWIPVDMNWFTGCMKDNNYMWLRPDLFDHLGHNLTERTPICSPPFERWDFNTIPPLSIPVLTYYTHTGTKVVPNNNGAEFTRNEI